MTELIFKVYMYGSKKYQLTLFDRNLINHCSKEEVLRRMSETIDLFEDTNKPKRKRKK
jgi:hypothetical protein